MPSRRTARASRTRPVPASTTTMVSPLLLECCNWPPATAAEADMLPLSVAAVFESDSLVLSIDLKGGASVSAMLLFGVCMHRKILTSLPRSFTGWPLQVQHQELRVQVPHVLLLLGN